MTMLSQDGDTICFFARKSEVVYFIVNTLRIEIRERFDLRWSTWRREEVDRIETLLASNESSGVPRYSS